jgi:orotidine-5'-phosphate decarboxylase
LEIPTKKLIIALDDLDLKAALDIVALTKSFASTFKVGLSLFCAYGPRIVYEINALGADVFLDLKLHDIPMQVSKAVENILALKPRFLSLHALGGRKMLSEALEVAKGSDTTLLAVTILTSLDHVGYNELGFSDVIERGVMGLTDLAISSGFFGIISSPHEAKKLKTIYQNNCFLVCPGIRPKNSEVYDQKRIMAPREAILAGADVLVVGRPITKAGDVVFAAQNVNQEIENALLQNSCNSHV